VREVVKEGEDVGQKREEVDGGKYEEEDERGGKVELEVELEKVEVETEEVDGKGQCGGRLRGTGSSWR
jgi:hypothetical protein